MIARKGFNNALLKRGRVVLQRLMMWASNPLLEQFAPISSEELATVEEWMGRSDMVGTRVGIFVATLKAGLSAIDSGIRHRFVGQELLVFQETFTMPEEAWRSYKTRQLSTEVGLAAALVSQVSPANFMSVFRRVWQVSLIC